MLASKADPGGGIMQLRAVLLAAVLVLVPLGARAADLVVWWEQGYNPEEDAAVREIVAAFEQKTGKTVDLSFHVQWELPKEIEAVAAEGRAPDLAYGVWLYEFAPRWAYEGRLVDLAETVGPFADMFAPKSLAIYRLFDGTTGRRGLYGLPLASGSNHIHVWKSLLERAGFTLADIPQEWQEFWDFWCDRVQPAVRQATGREDIWGAGLAMSAVAGDIGLQLTQFLHAHEADYVTPDGRLVIDDPAIRRRMVEALDGYTEIWRKGCTPPDAVDWRDADNNKAFLAGRVVMTVNGTLSIPNALRIERPEDYYENTATIAWPLGRRGNRFPIADQVFPVVVFRAGSGVPAAKSFIRFLVEDGWIAHWINFVGDRYLPTLHALLDQPFWLDPSDPHRMASVMQAKEREDFDYIAASGDWRHGRVNEERVWQGAVHRVVAEGISPEQAVDETIARIKQILSE
jgi:multiple sugar transport system substrate-binding protein